MRYKRKENKIVRFSYAYTCCVYVYVEELRGGMVVIAMGFSSGDRRNGGPRLGKEEYETNQHFQPQKFETEVSTC